MESGILPKASGSGNRWQGWWSLALVSILGAWTCAPLGCGGGSQASDDDLDGSTGDAPAGDERSSDGQTPDGSTGDAPAGDEGSSDGETPDGSIQDAPTGDDGPAVVPVDVYDCVESFTGPSYTKHFDLSSDYCWALDDSDGCYFYYYEAPTVVVPDQARFDQRGVEAYQVTFPSYSNRWGALYLGRQDPANNYCYAGGAHIGRNPLAMTWGPEVHEPGDVSPGGKARKNNFLLIGDERQGVTERDGGGILHVEGVRVHNMHDALYATTNQAGYHISHSWFSWNRDDLFEGYLHNLEIRDTLIDGVFTFISDPDGDCTDAKRAADRVIVIENSLIRLQRMPGPYGGAQPDRWHWKVDGGFALLWKHDSCGWEDWPQFVLRNNVFLFDGPMTTQYELYSPGNCSLGLPSECGTDLPNVKECENNLFLYAQYPRWTEEGTSPGATPLAGGRFYNPENPEFLPNGVDCYQRITDDPEDPGFGDPVGTWRTRRSEWIRAHTASSDPRNNVMQIPGVDTPGVEPRRAYQLRNKASGLCVQSGSSGAVSMVACDSRDLSQQWTVEAYPDGKLLGALLFRNGAEERGVLRTQDPIVLETDNSDLRLDPAVFWEDAVPGAPAFRERWYVLPLGNEPGGEPHTYAIESDAIRRSYVYCPDETTLHVLPFFVSETSTPLPQAAFDSGDDARLQWYLDPI